MSYVGWNDGSGTIHAVEPGNFTFAICGAPLEELLPNQSLGPWDADHAPIGLCEDCNVKLVVRDAQ